MFLFDKTDSDSLMELYPYPYSELFDGSGPGPGQLTGLALLPFLGHIELTVRSISKSRNKMFNGKLTPVIYQLSHV